MEDIHIKRFKDQKLQGLIEPADGAWTLHVTDEGPYLMVRSSYEDDDGNVKHGYIDVRDIPEGVTVKEIAESVATGPCELNDDDVVVLHGQPTRVGDLKVAS
jgi:hypothetical protein